MTSRKIEKPEWERFFDDFSRKFLKGGAPELTRIAVLTADFGLQFESSLEKLLGVTFDPKDDALEFHFGSFVHRVFHPREIHTVERDDGFVTALKVLVERVELRMRRGHEEVVSLTESPGYRALLETSRRSG